MEIPNYEELFYQLCLLNDFWKFVYNTTKGESSNIIDTIKSTHSMINNMIIMYHTGIKRGIEKTAVPSFDYEDPFSEFTISLEKTEAELWKSIYDDFEAVHKPMLIALITQRGFDRLQELAREFFTKSPALPPMFDIEVAIAQDPLFAQKWERQPKKRLSYYIKHGKSVF